MDNNVKILAESIIAEIHGSIPELKDVSSHHYADCDEVTIWVAHKVVIWVLPISEKSYCPQANVTCGIIIMQACEPTFMDDIIEICKRDFIGEKIWVFV